MTDLFPRLPGLGPGTMVLTDDGELPVEWLAAGDMLLTRDNGFQPIIHLARIRPGGPYGAQLPDPVVLLSDPLGRTTAEPDRLCLAPGHRVLLNMPQLDLYFGAEEALACVADLSRQYKQRRGPALDVRCYTQIIMLRHEVILAGGIWVETTDADMAAQLDLPPVIQRTSALFDQSSKNARLCLTPPEAALIRHLTPHDTCLRDLLIPRMVA